MAMITPMAYLRFLRGVLWPVEVRLVGGGFGRGATGVEAFAEELLAD
jgi:hypothetical protein